MSASLIDPQQWDGGDFFMVWPLPRYIFATDKVVKFMRDEKLTGIAFTPLDQLKSGSELGPGRLSDYMPEDRAHELGDSLGIY